MSPEEHYAESEKMLKAAEFMQHNDAEATPSEVRVLIAAAQVHATLATFKPVPRYVPSKDAILRFDAGGVITKETP